MNENGGEDDATETGETGETEKSNKTMLPSYNLFLLPFNEFKKLIVDS